MWACTHANSITFCSILYKQIWYKATFCEQQQLFYWHGKNYTNYLSLQQTMHQVPLTTILQTIAVVTYTLLCCIHCNTFSQQQFSGDLLLPSLTWCIYTTLMRMLCIAHLTHVLTIDDCGSHGHRRLLGFIQSLSFNYDCCGNLKLVLKLWSKVPN